MYRDVYQIAEIRTALFMYYHHAHYVPSDRLADWIFRTTVFSTVLGLAAWMVVVLLIFPDVPFGIKATGGVFMVVVLRGGCAASRAARKPVPSDAVLQQEAEALAEALPVLDVLERELLDELLRAMRFWQTAEIAFVLDRISLVSGLAHWPLVIKLRSIIIR